MPMALVISCMINQRPAIMVNTPMMLETMVAKALAGPPIVVKSRLPQGPKPFSPPIVPNGISKRIKEFDETFLNDEAAVIESSI